MVEGQNPSTGRATGGSADNDFELIPTSFGNEKKPVSLPCVFLDAPPLNRVFHARDDILRIIENELLPNPPNLITQQASTLRQFALCGFGGLGKTEIAQEFARRHRDAFDAVL